MVDHKDYLSGEAPMAHHESHESLGSDEISVDGLHGALADNQPCIAHDLGGAKHVADSLADLNTKVSDATLEDKTVLENTMDGKIATHAAIATVHQDAPALILTHKGDAAAHHSKYTDNEAVAAIYAAKPCFHGELSASQSNVTGDGTNFSLLGAIWTEYKDQGSCWLNGQFTAPATGIYLFTGIIFLGGLLNTHTYAYVILSTSNRTYYVFSANPWGIAGGTSLAIPFATYADMDSGDFASLAVRVYYGTKVVDITTSTFFGGSRII
jgi:hypothetical protein